MKGYCPECKRNVRGIKKKLTLGKFLLTGGAGRLVTKKNKCPICYSKLEKRKD